MQVLAPAKINLSLRVLGKRADGFHDIETLIAPISLFDELEIEKQSRWVDFQCDDPTVPAGDDNLVVRAAKLFFESTKQKGGVSIRLKKKIPHGAGLGGGSSDAASTLLALNELFETHLPREALAQMAASIGSDVASFVFQSATVCQGRGELVTPVKLSEPMSILLVKPEFGVSTQWAYKRWQDSRPIPGIRYEPQQFGNETWHRRLADDSLAGSQCHFTFVNDLEIPVFEKFLFLAQTKMWLLKQPEVGAAMMSGSGSTMFAVMRAGADSDAVAQRVRKELDPELWTHACETR